MKIVNLSPDEYKEWDRFCLESDEAWFWHTSRWLEYTLNYRPEFKPVSRSFFLVDNGHFCAICPLILETREGVKEFSYGGDCGPTIAFANQLTPKQRHKVEKLMYEHVDQLAKNNDVYRASFKFPVLDRSFLENSDQKYNNLMKFGYLDNSINTQVIDVSKPIEELEKGVRHGHWADIVRGSRILKAEVFDKSNITEEIFNQYVDLHHKAAGRITRPKATFENMLTTIRDGEGFLVGAIKEGVFIGFAYFYLFKDNVYWGSGCNYPGLRHLPIAHFIQWTAIQWMHDRGISFYEIGWQNYQNSLLGTSIVKEVNISKFKRGFGGGTVPLFRAEKYYNKNYFLSVYQKRINDYAESIKNSYE